MTKRKIVIASDSFKGTLSSLDICNLFKSELKNREDISPIFLPIADGGEGSLEAISHILDGEYIDIEVNDLYFKKIQTRYFIDKNNNAYIETASCVGLGLIKENNNPGLVTTYGLGEQIKDALSRGCKTIYVFLGGSASNDGGVGLAAALGVKFFDKDDKEFIPTGLTLKNITKIDVKNVKEADYVALTDVLSPFYGPEGAAFKFAPQKGATLEEVVLLDEGLKHLSNIINKDLGVDISNAPGAGAAGGLGGGLIAFMRAQVKSGINAILDLINFDEIIKNADLVISGEGKLDKQTFDGKVINGVASHCVKANKPLDIIVGISEVSFDKVKEMYPCVLNVYETNENHLPFDEVKKTAKEDYIKQINKLLNDMRSETNDEQRF